LEEGLVQLVERNRLFADRITAADLDLEQVMGRDPLTNLFNRFMMQIVGYDLVERRKANNSYLSVFFIDLDGFKTINDNQGHAAGNRVLQIVGETLIACFRAEDYSFRIGGDEFVVAASANEQDAERLVERLRDLLDGIVSFSVGVVTKKLCPTDSINLEQLIEEADRRMYDEKAIHHQQQPALARA
jgi:diguanylate cyclase (GGDEF)-like protein